MAINIYDYNDSYFKDLRDEGSTINSEDIDRQFKELVTYINDILRPAVDDIAAVVAEGVQDSAGTLFQNNGAGGTSWAYINPRSAIRDGEIAWKKLRNGTAGSILATNDDGVVSELTPADANQILQIADDNGTLKPMWKELSLDSVVDRFISGNKIAINTLDVDNFQDGVLSPELKDKSVTSNKLVDGVVTSNKFSRLREERGGEYDRIIGLLPMDIPYLQYDKLFLKIENLYDQLAASKVANNTITSNCFSKGFNSVEGLYIGYIREASRVIADGSITAAKLYLPQGITASWKLARGAIVPAIHIQAGTIDKNCFDDATKALFTAKGL